jgi:hypothetical protein
MEINYKLAAYILLAAAIGIYGVMWFFKSGRSIGGVLYLVLAILIFVFFGLRWFGGVASSNAPTAWPPVINSCPDYLTAFKRTVAGKQINTCIDTIGVSTKSYGNGGIKKWEPSMRFDNPPTDDGYYFDPTMPAQTVGGVKPIEALCQRTMAAGLTWEGVCDGENCYIQNADSSTATAGGAGCPAPA